MAQTKQNKQYILVLDVGTTGVKAFVFDKNLDVVAKVYKPLEKYFPQENWVEQSPEDLLKASTRVLRGVVRKSKLPGSSFLGLGITNQRETTILWDKKTGSPVYPAIVWEDTRTKKFSQDLSKRFGKRVQQKTGLTIEPYFSASKIRWILENSIQAKELLGKGDLAFGTIDSWILWNFLDPVRNKASQMSGAPSAGTLNGVDGNSHITDYTNASRTLLFNIKTLKWDKELLDIFQIPAKILPEVKPSQSVFGNVRKDIVGFPIPILAVCGDQQASMYAAGIKKGTTKITYGTGTFIMQILGPQFLVKEPFFTTLVPNKKRPVYALETKIDCCGKKVESVLNKPKKLKTMLLMLAEDVDSHIKELPLKPKELIIDGGVSRDGYIASIQTAVSKIPVREQEIFDGTALGVAKLVSSAS